MHIESRKSIKRPSQFEIYVDVQCENNTMEDVVHALQHEVDCVTMEEYENAEEEVFDFPPMTPTSPSIQAGTNYVT